MGDGAARCNRVQRLACPAFLLDVIPPRERVADDLGVLAFAFATVARHIDDDVRAKAKAKLRDWFGPTAGKG